MQSFIRTEQRVGVTYEGYENRLLHKYNDFIKRKVVLQENAPVLRRRCCYIK